MPGRLEELRRKRTLQKKLAKRRNKPRFIRYLSWRFWKFERREYWRKPKGNDNKMRLQIKGYPPIDKSGYGTERSIRGLHPSGLKPVIIYNKDELKKVDPEKQIAYIASTVGLRKRMEIIEEAKKLGVRLANAGV